MKKLGIALGTLVGLVGVTAGTVAVIDNVPATKDKLNLSWGTTDIVGSSAQSTAKDKETIENLTQEKDELTEENNGLSMNITIIQQDIAEKEAEIEANKQQISELTASNTALQSQVSTLTSDIETKQTEISGLETQIEVNNTRIAELEATGEANAQEITALQNANAEHEATINSLNEQIAEKQQSLSWTQQQLSQKEAQITTLQNTNAEHEATITSLNEQIELLNTRISELEAGGVVGSASIALPEALISSTKLFVHEVNSDVVLISGDAVDCGLWRYKRSTGDMKQVFSDGSHFNGFTNVDTGSIVSNDKGATEMDMTVYYDIAQDKCVEVAPYSLNNVAHYVGNKLIVVFDDFGMPYAFRVIDLDTLISKELVGFSECCCDFIPVDNDRCVVNNSDACAFFLLNLNTLESSQLTALDGVYDVLYSYENKLIVRNTETLSMHIYNIDSGALNLIYENAGSYNRFQEVGNKILIGSSANSIDTDLLALDKTTEEVSIAYDEGKNWNRMYVVGLNCLVFSDSTGTALLYESETGNVTTYSVTSSMWRNKVDVGDNLIINGPQGILLFNSSKKTLTKEYSGSCDYQLTEHKVGDNYVLVSPDGTKVFYLNVSTSTVSLITSAWGSFDTFELDGDNLYLSNSDTSVNPIVLNYTVADGVVRVWKYAF